MGISATTGGCRVWADTGAVGGGIGGGGTAVRLIPQDEQKATPGGTSLPQLGQYDMILVLFFMYKEVTLLVLRSLLINVSWEGLLK